uniref:Uncharacterized protein n=1 Tax=Pongo abelii TaxID=9601 RepID=A0A8I5TMN1_PONAB
MHHTQLIFVFLVEMGFHHVGQADLKLPTFSDPPILDSQSASITGMSHCAWPIKLYSILMKKKMPPPSGQAHVIYENNGTSRRQSNTSPCKNCQRNRPLPYLSSHLTNIDGAPLNTGHCAGVWDTAGPRGCARLQPSDQG